MSDTPITLEQGIEGLLGGEAAKPTDPPEEAKADMSDAEAKSPEDADDHPEADVEAEPEGEPEADEDATEAVEDAPERHAVKANGQDYEVTLDELKQTFSLRKDLDRGRSENVAERKKIGEEVAQLQQERNNYLEVVQTLQQNLAEQGLEDPPDDLYQSDPVEFLRQKDVVRTRREKIQQLDVERNRTLQEQHVQAAQQYSQHLASQKDLLLQRIPEWADRDVYDREAKEVRDYAVETLGFSPEEVDKSADHRAVAALRKAMQYDQLMAKGLPSIEKKVREAAPTIKQGRTVKPQPKSATQKLDDKFARVAGAGGPNAYDAAADLVLARAAARKG
jgi:hypothetical protein